MTVKNIQYWRNVPFEQYLTMGGVSFSKAKHEGATFTPTEKMRLGTQVDAYLNEPARFDGDIARIKPIAGLLMQRLGSIYHKFEKQLTITADFIHDGMVLHYQGRPDWCMIRSLIVDLKISEGIFYTIDFFGYPDQLSGYAFGAEAKQALILAAHPDVRKKRTDLIRIAISDYWWIKQIEKYGEPI